MVASSLSSWSRRSIDDPLTEQDEEDEVGAGAAAAAAAASESRDETGSPSQSTSPVQRAENERRGSDESWSDQNEASGSTARQTSQQTSNVQNGSGQSKVPAAGVGTRVGPRPVPRSSSSLRHISSKGRTTSFGVSVPENRDPSQQFDGLSNGSADGRSTVQRTVEAAQRRSQQQTQRETAMESGTDDDRIDDVDDDEDDEDDDLNFGSSNSAISRRRRADHDKRSADELIQGSSSLQGGALNSSSDEEDWALNMPDVTIKVHHQDGLDDSAGNDGEGNTNGQATEKTRTDRSPSRHASRTKKASATRHKRRAGPSMLDGDSPPLLGTANGMQTPGPSFPQDLHTPVGTPPELHLENTVTPQERLEWHTMLQSVLRSEVLKSETKRITSDDAQTITRQQLMYKRWLDIRASLRGRGFQRGAVEAEEKRLNEGWPILVKQTIGRIHACRADGGVEPDYEDDDEAREAVLQEVGDLLDEVDSAEEQFPSFRKIVEVVPEWNDEAIQHKLEGLYSWYNVTNSLRTQIRILQDWTGSKTLDVESSNQLKEAAVREDDPHGYRAELEEGTFLERILKENSLQSTFENRTLRTLNQLILKAKEAIVRHHAAFSEMALPSFEPELVQLINFPTRLMEGALRVRLDYVGKLNDPSVLIVDSLIDDLRAAIALACRIKIQYTSMMVPLPEKGWDLPPCVGSSYDAVLREALQYFFKLLNYKLKGSLFFKETEILEPEWRFLSTAVEAIEGADILVARSITKIVNKLFIRIVKYFERELSAPSTRRSALHADENAGANGGHLLPRMPAAAVPNGGASRGPSIAGGLTKGLVKVTLDEKIRWIRQVFDSVRIRSRKLLGFARDIRNRLENAAEYDLSTLRIPERSATDDASQVDVAEGSSAPLSSAAAASGTPSMDLTEFLQTLINAGYFLVLTGSFEAEGIYLIAEPSLQDKPEVVQELFTKCLRRVRPKEEERALAAAELRSTVQTNSRMGGTQQHDESGKDEESDGGGEKRASDEEDEANAEQLKYLLVLTPRDAFMWTGKVMCLTMDRVDVDLKDRRLRLIADGPQRRLELCKKHLYNVFNADYAAVSVHQETEDNAEDSRVERAHRRPSMVKSGRSFPLEIVDESLAHMSAVQSELRRINKGVYMLSDSVNRAVPKIRRKMRGRRGERARSDGVATTTLSKGYDSDELIQNCFSMAAEQGFRAMPFIESARLRGQMTLALARLAIDWVAFICDDCEPTDRRTFKWAVAALENAMHVTRSESILQIDEDDFVLMRSKVASCVGLLISHFDILGARSSVAKAKEEEQRLERERSRALEAASGLGNNSEVRLEAAKLIEGSGGAGAPPMLGRTDSGMQATEERWVQKVMEWDAARQAIEAEQRLIGRVLDDTRLEDRGLQFLASSSSRIQIRWQQGRFIGGGTFGTVYLAVNLDSGGLMAVKEIRFQDINSTPSMYKQIKDEMSVMEMLSHPNIVEYYGIEVHRDKVYIFEEYCQGGSLAQLLEHGRIEDEMVMQVYTLQMLDGLVYLHSKGVVHRDIKPDNILLDHMGVIKFVDFGAAKVLAKNSRTIQRSRRPGIVGPQAMAGMLGPDGKPAAAASLQGTPMYMSPEVIKGETRGRRGAMDVWSLGCVVLEFATGRRPWSQLDNEWAIMFHIGMAQQHPPLPEPGQLSDLGIDFIRNCLIIDPYDRPSAAEMREHAWIKNLVEALNTANEEEEAAASAAAAAGAGTSATSSLAGGGGGGSLFSQSGGGSGARSSVDGSVSSLGQSFKHGNDSAAGVAAMAATPGTRSINAFNFGRAAPSGHVGSSSSSFSRLALESPATTAGLLGLGGRGGAATGGSREDSGGSSLSGGTTEDSEYKAMTLGGGDGNLVSSTDSELRNNDGIDEQHTLAHRPAHTAGHPDHTHPGYDALVADLAYRQEEQQIRRMTAPESESGIADDEDDDDDDDDTNDDGAAA